MAGTQAIAVFVGVRAGQIAERRKDEGLTGVAVVQALGEVGGGGMHQVEKGGVGQRALGQKHAAVVGRDAVDDDGVEGEAWVE